MEKETLLSYPRECGGDPNMLLRVVSQIPVIPANAGVILVLVHNLYLSHCYPRECGGDPDTIHQ